MGELNNYHYTSFRLAFGLEYNGRDFFGWQYQPNLRTVQGVLWQAFRKLFGEKVLSTVAIDKYGQNVFPEFLPNNIVAAGRTDRGVHARASVIHAEIPIELNNREIDSWMRGLNSHLPADVRILWCKKVADSFNARMSAKSRTYRYFLQNSKTPSAILKGLVGNYWHELDINKMQNAASYLIGEHNFSSFRSSECQAKNPIRIIYNININNTSKNINLINSELIVFELKANAFLHHMVRNIIGTLIEVGNGKKPEQWVQEVLQAQDRTYAAMNFMPDGLYLWEVEYEEIFLR